MSIHYYSPGRGSSNAAQYLLHAYIPFHALQFGCERYSIMKYKEFLWYFFFHVDIKNIFNLMKNHICKLSSTGPILARFIESGWKLCQAVALSSEKMCVPLRNSKTTNLQPKKGKIWKQWTNEQCKTWYRNCLNHSLALLSLGTSVILSFFSRDCSQEALSHCLRPRGWDLAVFPALCIFLKNNLAAPYLFNINAVCNTVQSLLLSMKIEKAHMLAVQNGAIYSMLASSKTFMIPHNMLLCLSQLERNTTVNH